MQGYQKLALTAVALAALAGGALAQGDEAIKSLKVGDKAPPLDVAHWLKGEEVTTFDEDKVYVVEFWATWCGPCRTSMPHITELQSKYKDYGVTFIGISDEKLQTVFTFLKQEEWDTKTGYTMATDPDRSVYTDYMKAAGQGGIPTAFVVGKEGEIEWIGHPMNIDPVIDALAHGTWDREAHAEKEAEQQAAMRKLGEAYQMLMNQETAERGLALLKESISGVWDNAQALNQISWEMTTSEQVAVRDHDFALKLAARAAELTHHESGMILDTLARVYYEKGDVKKALEIQKKAVEHAEAGFEDDLQEWLEKYEKEAGGGR